jgi:hypothetical protein
MVGQEGGADKAAGEDGRVSALFFASCPLAAAAAVAPPTLFEGMLASSSANHNQTVTKLCWFYAVVLFNLQV